MFSDVQRDVTLHLDVPTPVFEVGDISTLIASMGIVPATESMSMEDILEDVKAKFHEVCKRAASIIGSVYNAVVDKLASLFNALKEKSAQLTMGIIPDGKKTIKTLSYAQCSQILRTASSLADVIMAFSSAIPVNGTDAQVKAFAQRGAAMIDAIPPSPLMGKISTVISDDDAGFSIHFDDSRSAADISQMNTVAGLGWTQTSVHAVTSQFAHLRQEFSLAYTRYQALYSKFSQINMDAESVDSETSAYRRKATLYLHCANTVEILMKQFQNQLVAVADTTLKLGDTVSKKIVTDEDKRAIT